MNIETLKQELREFIKLSETITPGKWTNLKNGVASSDGHILCMAGREENFAFIARSRNISPTMAKMLLVAVESLECLYEDTEGYADGAPDASAHDLLCNDISSDTKAALQQLLKLWEETK